MSNITSFSRVMPIRCTGGESSTLYLYSKEAARNIKEYTDNSRFIVVLREPVDYLYSLHAQYVKEAGENIEDFKVALEMESYRRKGRGLNETVRAPSLLFYSERIKYAGNLERFLKVFGKERIMILFAEDLRVDTEGKIKEIFRWLGLDDEMELNIQRKNVSEVARFKVLQKFMNTPWFARFKNFVLNLLPEKSVAGATRVFHLLTRKRSSREKLDGEYRMELRRWIKPEVVELKVLFDKYNIPLDPVRKWGYDKS